MPTRTLDITIAAPAGPISLSLHPASLVVAAANGRAIAVYRQKFGFEHVETLPNEFNNGVEYLLMRLDLERGN
jgi:ribosomal protein S18 acetylase RimI-like enzyme